VVEVLVTRVDGGEAGFRFVGGALCLDFTNTVDNRLGPEPRDKVRSCRDLLAWGRESGALDGGAAQVLAQHALNHPDDADAALRRALGLREALYRTFTAVAAGSEPSRVDLAILNTVLSQAMTNAAITWTGGGFAWSWHQTAQLSRLVWPVARSAADLLTSRESVRVRICANDICGWLFADTTGRRRWCEMRGCGNRAKAARYYNRRHDHDG
jgi:predicted RNA-binding Zn ribbon-like protein